MSRILIAVSLAAGMIPVALPPGSGLPMQVQMPSQTIQGQTRTPPGKAWPGKKAPGAKATAAPVLKPLNTPGAAAAQGAASGTNAAQDRQIEATIQAKLAKSKIGKDGLTVRVQGGVAYWEGSTSVVQHKGSATRMAKSAGAKSVVNNIKVADAAKQKAAENLDQGRRRVQVKRGEATTRQ